MSYVNADTNTILEIWKNMKTAISSVESTKASISKNYLKIGEFWKDKKYKELEVIVHDCNNSLNSILKTLLQGEKYLYLLAKSLKEYEDTKFVHSTKQENTTNKSEGVDNRKRDISELLKGVEYKPIKPSLSARSEEQIISSISGGDKTKGSCSSLALAYAGSRAGYTIYDFRGGRSLKVFSSRSSIEQIANMDGVNSVILRGTDDTICAKKLMSKMEKGRQYYFATGQHAAVIRMNNEGTYQYLELQSGTPSRNGWHPLTLRSLYNRFRCSNNRQTECSNYLIELNSLQSNSEFLNLLGYINTDKNAQIKGSGGHER